MADIQIIDYICETHGTFTYSSKTPNDRETTIQMLSIFFNVYVYILIFHIVGFLKDTLSPAICRYEMNIFRHCKIFFLLFGHVEYK